MLKKIVCVRNVGRFLNYTALGDVEFKRYTLIFAENGRGKSTLCAVLRSLQSGSADRIVGRASLGTTGRPEVTIILDGQTAALREGSWSVAVPNLAIFDSTFVSDNVYSGEAVSIDHKRSLYKLVVGREGVELARQIEALDTASREKSAEIRERRALIQALAPAGFTVETFLALVVDAGIDAKIVQKERELQALREADVIKSHAALSELTLPRLPDTLVTLLHKSIEGVVADVEHRVAEQIARHAMLEHGEQWLSQGLGYVKLNECPFCGRSLEGVELVDAYRVHFGQAYNDLKKEMGGVADRIAEQLGEREIASCEKLLVQNAASVEFWGKYCTIVAPEFPKANDLGGSVRGVRDAALGLLRRKAAAPLDPVEPDASFRAAEAALAGVRVSAGAYNQAVHAANAVIAGTKAATAAGSVRDAERHLAFLQATKRRHQNDAKIVCEAYETALAEKKALEWEKDTVKEKLDRYSGTVIQQYERAINQLLEDFGAGFRIGGAKHGYPGGVASSTYQIVINDTPVELGDPETPLDRPSFKNTLSSGDRGTLALAFFLAQLAQDPERAGKIAVFDDPFSSQDAFRKDCTVQKIRKCGELCSQVIVLSHDQNFLKRVWDRLASEADDRRCLQLRRIGLRNTAIGPWDIEEATQARYTADLNALTAYHNAGDGNARDIVARIRPVLETYCRQVFPSDFSATDMLGTIIGKVRTAGTGHQLYPELEDLEALNEYTRRYHHGENPNAATESLNDGELQGFVRKALQITGAA